MNTTIYQKLVKTAQERKLITYGEIAPLANLNMDDDKDRSAMAEILGEIARHEQAAERPMLTSVVIHRGRDNNPGEGFYAIAQEFRRYGGSRDPVRRTEFWAAEVAAAHNHWSAKSPSTKIS
jgi:hypothetical protein